MRPYFACSCNFLQLREEEGRAELSTKRLKNPLPEARIELTTFALRICRSRPTPLHPAAADSREV